MAPLTELPPLQTQRPVGVQRRKVYGKKKVQFFDPVFIMPSKDSTDTKDSDVSSNYLPPPPRDDAYDATLALDRMRLDAKPKTSLPTLKLEEDKLKEDGRSSKSTITKASDRSRRQSSLPANTGIRPAMSLQGMLMSLLQQNAHPDYSNSFTEFGDDLERKFAISKIAEGTYADVYDIAPRKKCTGNKSIFKILPIRGKRSDRSMGTAVKEVLREVRLCDALTVLPGFTVYKGLMLVHGEYAKSFMEACDLFAEKTPEAIRPKPYRLYKGRWQEFAIMELEPAGDDGETLKDPSVFAVRDIFWLLVISLMNAEQRLDFEHRDLHISNICIDAWIKGQEKDVPPRMLARSGPRQTACLSNLRPTIIDYTLSRSLVPKQDTGGFKILQEKEGDSPYPPKEAMELSWNAETSWSEFKNHPNSDRTEDEEQCRTYGRMQACIEERAAAEKVTGPGKYKLFAPKTNVVWMMYILWVLVKRGKGRLIEGGFTEEQEEMWGVLRRILDAYHQCEVAELPDGLWGFVKVARERDWLTLEDATFYRHALNDDETKRESRR